MPKPTVSVVVPVMNPGRELNAIVRSLDAQDLRYERFRISFVDLGSTDGTPDRLADLAAHRRNVEVLTAPDRVAAWQAGVARADSDYVVLLDAGDRLHRWALGSLLEHAESQNLDVVLGRTTGAGPIGFVPETAYGPWSPEDPDAAVALLAPVALIRTGLLRETLAVADTGWRASRVDLLAVTSAIGVLTDPPLGSGSGPSTGAPLDQVWRDADAAAQDLDGVVRARFIAAHAAASVRRGGPALIEHAELVTDVLRRQLKEADVSALAPGHRGVVAALLGSAEVAPGPDSGGLGSAVAASRAWSELRLGAAVTSAAWQDGRLGLDLRVSISSPSGPLPDGADEIGPTLLIRKSASRETYELPAEVELEPGEAGGHHTLNFRVRTGFDLSTAAGGRPLTHGAWHPRLRLSGSGSDLPLNRAIPAVALPGALIDGVPVRPYTEDGHLLLDVGAAKHGLFGRYRPSDATVTESADGSLFTLRLSEIAVVGDAVLPGKLYQGKFALPATLRADADGARIECYVSGLAGTSRLSAEFPPAVQQDLGLRLRIGSTGDLAVEPDSSPKSPAPKAPPKKTPATKAPARKAPAAKAAPAPKAAATSPTAKAYPAADSPDLVQRVLPIFKPAGRLLPKSVRKKVRRRYRKLIT